jgi:hypothetical protein
VRGAPSQDQERFDILESIKAFGERLQLIGL